MNRRLANYLLREPRNTNVLITRVYVSVKNGRFAGSPNAKPPLYLGIHGGTREDAPPANRERASRRAPLSPIHRSARTGGDARFAR